MGIPLDYTPPASRSRPSAGSGVRVSADAGSKPPADPTAAARSSIRRSPHPQPRRIFGRVHAARRPNAVLDPRDRYLILDAAARTVDRDRSYERDPSLPRIARNPMVDHSTGGPDSAESPAGLSRREIGRRLLRDSVNYTYPGRRMRIPRDMHGQDILPLAAPNTLRNRPSYSPRFAPAHPEDSGLTNSLETDDSSTTEGTMDASMPLLRRVGHRSVATARNSPSIVPALPLPRAESVMSTDDEAPDVSDSWARLLNTIPLDNHLPSADSSFTSATASASASASRSSTAAPTTLTPSSSFGSTTSSRLHIMFDPFPSFSANCDYISSSENSDTEAEEDLERLRSHRRRSQPRSQSQSQSQTPTQTQNPTQSQSESNTPTDSFAPTASSFTLENEAAGLQLLHDTLNLLSRRDDIPDEWWATAGLTRII
ncbi:hypothetical protein MGYG_01856 [Nannizzia gypsea CBS 118893]|uniref:Uncharacterized protein n=1 Tax=Arthroderma gypseum (strain ATCC MYA-4604 / CBS 118893) TaxID=535722 RepID=E5R3Z5_ARTGP|nr:hypothetical protein MGYG_01856 [Nannizzia gypsea CBS 118893]EFQ98841.1 hypothetical protein MGYG_01856 [Nannizzia gypsea CBS 118893]